MVVFFSRWFSKRRTFPTTFSTTKLTFRSYASCKKFVHNHFHKRNHRGMAQRHISSLAYQSPFPCLALRANIADIREKIFRHTSSPQWHNSDRRFPTFLLHIKHFRDSGTFGGITCSVIAKKKKTAIEFVFESGPVPSGPTPHATVFIRISDEICHTIYRVHFSIASKRKTGPFYQLGQNWKRPFSYS